MHPSKRLYYEQEERLANRPGDSGHLNPSFPPGAHVVSVGCGGGWAGEAGNAARFVGVDIDEDAREFRLARNPADEIQIASGEELPFSDEEFTFYMARVSIMYMDVNKALAEAHRVLASGGLIWVTGHDFKHVAQHWWQSARHLRAKDLVFRTYVLVNGMACHLFGRTFRYPLKRSRTESFQTKRSLRRGLVNAGFKDVQFPPVAKGLLLVTAKKP